MKPNLYESYAIKNAKKQSSSVSQINFSGTERLISFVLLSGDRLYTVIDDYLYIYSMKNLSSFIQRYPFDKCFNTSGVITETHLYVTSWEKLNVLKLTSDDNNPLQLLNSITLPVRYVFKILRVGNELLLGEWDGYL